MNSIKNEDEINKLIEDNSFKDVINHFNKQLNMSNSDNNSNSDSESYDEDDEITILDNYLLNQQGENITDILTKINNNLTNISNFLQEYVTKK